MTNELKTKLQALHFLLIALFCFMTEVNAENEFAVTWFKPLYPYLIKGGTRKGTRAAQHLVSQMPGLILEQQHPENLGNAAPGWGASLQKHGGFFERGDIAIALSLFQLTSSS